MAEAKNIKIANATYPSVPAVVLKSDSGENVTFTDTSIGADAVASDILIGKKAYVNGSLLVGTYSGGGSGKNIQTFIGTGAVNTTSKSATSVKLTVAKTGTYTVGWTSTRANNKSGFATQLYIDGKAYGSEQSTFTNTYAQGVKLTNVPLTAGSEIVVYGKVSSVIYPITVGNLIIEEQ